MESLRSKKGFICDMDGVIYHGNRLLPGVKEFVEWLQKEEKQFLFLTNASSRSPKELQNKLYRMGLEIGEEHFYTSALATAKFLQIRLRDAALTSSEIMVYITHYTMQVLQLMMSIQIMLSLEKPLLTVMSTLLLL